MKARDNVIKIIVFMVKKKAHMLNNQVGFFIFLEISGVWAINISFRKEAVKNLVSMGK